LHVLVLALNAIWSCSLPSLILFELSEVVKDELEFCEFVEHVLLVFEKWHSMLIDWKAFLRRLDLLLEGRIADKVVDPGVQLPNHRFLP
jgi:hypothetical protein